MPSSSVITEACLSVVGGNFHQHGGYHGCPSWRQAYRRTHVAGFCHLSGDKAEGALHQTDQRGIAGAARVIDEVVQHHARIGVEAECRAVGEYDRHRGAAGRLHDVALAHGVAPTFSATDTPLRTTLQLPDNMSTRPITGCPACCTPSLCRLPRCQRAGQRAATMLALSVAPSGEIRCGLCRSRNSRG